MTVLDIPICHMSAEWGRDDGHEEGEADVAPGEERDDDDYLEPLGFELILVGQGLAAGWFNI